MHGNVQSSLLNSYSATLTRVGILEGEGAMSMCTKTVVHTFMYVTYMEA